MDYSYDLIHISDELNECGNMYSLVLLNAKNLCITLSGVRCYLDGKYFLCLNSDDTIYINNGSCDAINLRFMPYFYNVNLNHKVLGMYMYDEMRDKFGYPDFRMFRMRADGYFGIIPITAEQYEISRRYLIHAKEHINAHDSDFMWSCRTRSNMISLLHIAENAYFGIKESAEDEIFRYINDNIDSDLSLDALCKRFNTNRTTLAQIIKDKTGLPPSAYIAEIRLLQSRPDLLFTKLPINEIAEKYGFTTANYYIRAFKKRFGKSPLQYRNDGYLSRINNEGVYHKKEKEEMTEAEFRQYFLDGLGRAVLMLKEQDNKEPFKQVFKEIVFHGLFDEKEDGDIVFQRACGIYEKEILDVFNDKAFEAEIAEIALNEIRKPQTKQTHRYYTIPLLSLMGYRKEAEQIIEEKYTRIYKELKEYCKENSKEQSEEHPKVSGEYMSVCSALARYLKVGDERIKQILFDIADLYDYGDYPVIPTRSNPFFIMRDGVGEHFFNILDEVKKEHKHGEKLDMQRRMVPLNEDFIPTAKQIFEIYDENFVPLEYRIGFAKADRETILTIAQAVLDETDMEKKKYLLTYFAPMAEIAPAPEFPLDVTSLIKIAEEENFVIDDEVPFSFSYFVLGMLSNIRSNISKEIGDMLLARNCGVYERQMAIRVRFMKNYSEVDRELFEDYMCLDNKADTRSCIGAIIDGLRGGAKEVYTGNLAAVYAKCPNNAIRKDLIDQLIKARLLPEHLRKECLHDSNQLIRKAAETNKAKNYKSYFAI